MFRGKRNPRFAGGRPARSGADGMGEAPRPFRLGTCHTTRDGYIRYPIHRDSQCRLPDTDVASFYRGRQDELG
ncbi:hypothetical protein J27TS7_19080 [Paenibacillus dendritiformis]|nr:hypothetical protein J27TS7_19080 [Paenibacillus dendritiformis]